MGAKPRIGRRRGNGFSGTDPGALWGYRLCRDCLLPPVPALFPRGLGRVLRGRGGDRLPCNSEAAPAGVSHGAPGDEFQTVVALRGPDRRGDQSAPGRSNLRHVGLQRIQRANPGCGGAERHGQHEHGHVREDGDSCVANQKSESLPAEMRGRGLASLRRTRDHEADQIQGMAPAKETHVRGSIHRFFSEPGERGMDRVRSRRDWSREPGLVPVDGIHGLMRHEGAGNLRRGHCGRHHQSDRDSAKHSGGAME